MKRICAWCDKIMDPGDPGTDQVTHGICPQCLAMWRLESITAIETMQEKEQARCLSITTTP